MSQLRDAQYRLPESIAYLQQAIDQQPAHVALHRELAARHIHAGEHSLALAQYHQAIDLQPDLPESRHPIGDMLRRIGDLDGAEQQFRETIDQHPTYTLTYAALADLVKFEPADPLFNTIDSLIASGTIPAGDRQHLHFALGKMFDDIGEFDTPFGHYQQGNQFANRRFSVSKNRQLIKDIITHWDQPVPAPKTDQPAKSGPVFVLGMPRSGSTLIEQILASHPDVSAAGKTPFIKNISDMATEAIGSGIDYPHYREQLTPALLKELADEYLHRMARLVGANSAHAWLVDKMPVNFLYIGLIIALFPNARIIHSRRDPLDVCLSCYFHNFSGGLNYTFDLTSLGQVYLDYLRLMRHWQALYPENILDVEYETLVDNQERESRKLIDFVGLEWDPACLDFHTTRRPLGTASLAQVRQPIYRRSLKRWHNYAEQLQPLAKILGVSTTPAK